MNITELPVKAIAPAAWNPNRMDEAMRSRLRRSVERFGWVVPLVVREAGKDGYEAVGGAQRLAVARELGLPTVPCVIVRADNVEARLLAQALNRIQGEDDLGLKAELVRELLKTLPQDGVTALLPETAASLQALASLCQEDLAQGLRRWQDAQPARLKHLQLHLTADQLEVVERAFARLLPRQGREERGTSPNARGTALYLLCKAYLEAEEQG